MVRVECGDVNSGHPEALEILTETKSIEETVLKETVEGRFPRCYKYGQKGHFRDNFLPPAESVYNSESVHPSPIDANEDVDVETRSNEWKIVGK